ncbi:transposase [Streptomyces sp. NPDC052101]|uniref:transposase n=1 Tax=Streptomyces sp. NPDC052101 TaxID=3155763 RepID=UPI003449D63B
MSDAEWSDVRDAMPVPAWLESRGGQPEGYSHRQMGDAVRYLVAGGITWRAVPANSPAGTVSTRSPAAGARRGCWPSCTTGCTAWRVRTPAAPRSRPPPSPTRSRCGPPPRSPRPLAATTRARRCPGASATSWWTASTCSWWSW